MNRTLGQIYASKVAEATTPKEEEKVASPTLQKPKTDIAKNNYKQSIMSSIGNTQQGAPQ